MLSSRPTYHFFCFSARVAKPEAWYGSQDLAGAFSVTASWLWLWPSLPPTLSTGGRPNGGSSPQRGALTDGKLALTLAFAVPNWLNCCGHLHISFHKAHLLPIRSHDLLPLIYTGASLIDSSVKGQYVTELPNQDKIRKLREKETYKYLGILEGDTIKQEEIKEKKRKLYFRKIRKLLETKLYSRHFIRGTNTWVVPLVRYSGLFLSGAEKNLNKWT